MKFKFILYTISDALASGGKCSEGIDLCVRLCYTRDTTNERKGRGRSWQRVDLIFAAIRSRRAARRAWAKNRCRPKAGVHRQASRRAAQKTGAPRKIERKLVRRAGVKIGRKPARKGEAKLVRKVGAKIARKAARTTAFMCSRRVRNGAPAAKRRRRPSHRAVAAAKTDFRFGR